ncbi:hypothetical protein [Rhodopirellula sp. SWK7]|uniref:hypothetical protein n=1 Tax=Rhodopirellula sp. SWK7 TaxID=595460 RepID=UPI001181A55F|nr:hypothetical protein [Rhodopirellula sp. SWK7]
MAGTSPAAEYNDLTAQQQADLSRFLGWVWADGKPLNTDQVTGIRSEVRHPKYKAVVERLLAIPELGMQLGNTAGEPDKQKIRAPWNYWINSLPGGNPGDPQLLRDAIRNPNFLAGVIEGEGGRSNNDQHYYIDDHFHGPARLDKLYGLAHFGPERILQLFELLGETYGFTHTTLRIGGDNQSSSNYTYAEIHEARADLRRRFDAAKTHNEAVNRTGESDYQKLIPTHLFIHPDNWDVLRSYGFFFAGRIPNSPTETSHRSIADGTFPASDLPLATGTMSLFGPLKK